MLGALMVANGSTSRHRAAGVTLAGCCEPNSAACTLKSSGHVTQDSTSALTKHQERSGAAMMPRRLAVLYGHSAGLAGSVPDRAGQVDGHVRLAWMAGSVWKQGCLRCRAGQGAAMCNRNLNATPAQRCTCLLLASPTPPCRMLLRRRRQHNKTRATESCRIWHECTAPGTCSTIAMGGGGPRAQFKTSRRVHSFFQRAHLPCTASPPNMYTSTTLHTSHLNG
jgi:hypothetical protein